MTLKYILQRSSISNNESNKINLDRVKSILIDLDDTVYNYQKCHDFALDKTYKIACSLIKKEITEIHFKRLYRNCRNIVTEKLKELAHLDQDY